MDALKDRISGNWNQIKGKLKEEYGEWAENELMYQEGKEDQMIGKIQEKTGKTKQELKEWIDDL